MKDKMIKFSAMTLMIMTGIALFIIPSSGLTSLIRILAVIFAVTGIGAMLSYVTAKEKAIMQYLYLIGGIVSTSGGLVMWSNPEFIISLIPIMGGVSIAAVGALHLIKAFQTPKSDDNDRKIKIVLSSLLVILGITMFGNPFAAIDIAVRIMAIGMIFAVIYSVWANRKTKRNGMTA